MKVYKEEIQYSHVIHKYSILNGNLWIFIFKTKYRYNNRYAKACLSVGTVSKVSECDSIEK